MRILKILVVEDDPNRIERFKKELRVHKVRFATSSDQAIEILENENFDLICLDHDLGGGAYEPSDENSGYGVAKHMEANKIPGEVIIHSLNPVGAANINSALPHAVRIPFISLFEDGRLRAMIWS